MESILTNFYTATCDGQQRTGSFGYPEDLTFPLVLRTRPNWKPSINDTVAHLE